jgi:hypothetical protein
MNEGEEIPDFWSIIGGKSSYANNIYFTLPHPPLIMMFVLRLLLSKVTVSLFNQLFFVVTYNYCKVEPVYPYNQSNLEEDKIFIFDVYLYFYENLFTCIRYITRYLFG